LVSRRALRTPTVCEHTHWVTPPKCVLQRCGWIRLDAAHPPSKRPYRAHRKALQSSGAQAQYALPLNDFDEAVSTDRASQDAQPSLKPKERRRRFPPRQ
jgi:hypothetical protein